MQKYYHTTLRLWRLLKPFHNQFYLQLSFIILAQGIQITTIYFSSRVLNDVISKQFILAFYFVMATLVITLIKYFINYHSDKLSHKYLATEIEQYMQGYSLQNIFNLNISQYLEDHSSVKLQVVTRGELAVQAVISTIVLNIIPTTTQVAFSILAICWFSPLVGLICLITFLIAIIWSNIFSRYFRPFLRKHTKNWDFQKKGRAEAFQHLSLIKLNGVEEDYLKKYLTNRATYIQFTVDTWQKSNLNNKLRFSYFNLSKALISVIVIYQAYLGKLLVGDIYAIWSWMNDAYNNMGNVNQAMRDIPINFIELETYLDIIDKVPEFNESGDKKFENGDIIFDHVSFKYPKAGAPVIEDLNIIIPEGKKIAFVGFSGSGKSTIIKLLLRMYDWDNGDIKIGKNDKVKSLREIDATALRQRIGYVEQHVDLFDTTIRENILFGISTNGKNKKNKLNEEELNSIIHKARIDQFFHRLGETGLDTIIGERGVKLSGGERQRIGIARALAKNPDILIFDEATASLDTENEKYIQEAIDDSSQGRTTIIIAHRLSTVQNSDIIFVMDKGRVVGQGTHEYLKQNNPEYQRLVHAQEN